MHAIEDCSWGSHCPICKNEEEHEEDWDGNMQKEQPRMCPQNTQHPSHKTLSAPVTKYSAPPAAEQSAPLVI